MITVAGLAPSLDITYVVDDLRLGAIHRPTATVRCAGGKPLNLARAAHRLGATAQVVAVLGGPTGQALESALRAEGVGVVVVPSAAESRTCVSIAATSTGELTEVYPYAEPLAASEWQAVCTALRTTLGTALRTAIRTDTASGGWLVISGGPPKDLPVTALADLVRIGHAAGCRVALDSHGPAVPAAVAERPELVKINRFEAAELLGTAADDDLGSMAAAIRERSGGPVVLTDAVAGALVLDGRTCTLLDLPGVRGAFPVGSGDSFLGGLLADLEAGHDLVSAAVTGVAAGTANALVPGPGVFDPAVVAELRTRVRRR